MSAIVTSTSTPGSMLHKQTTEGKTIKRSKAFARHHSCTKVEVLSKRQSQPFFNKQHVHLAATARTNSAYAGTRHFTVLHLIDVICLTTSAGECKSNSLLWIRISNRSQVLVPSPAGDFLVVMCSTLVGKRTGPFTFNCLSFAPLIRSAQTAGDATVSFEGA